MKIAVCMKQVPVSSEGSMDEKTGLINRAGLQPVTNVYDLSALETALWIKEQLKDKTLAEVVVFTMGPMSAGQVIREAFAYGADAGYLLSDRVFGGADVLTTSYTLMQGIQSTGTYELILCGRQTTDGDTAQVGGALAKWLEIPHVTEVAGMNDVSSEHLSITSTMQTKEVDLQVGFPCLLAVERNIFTPRMPSLKLKMEGRKKPLTVITLKDLDDQDESHYGLKGSATRVKRIFPPQRTIKQSLERLGGSEAAAKIEEILQEAGYF